MIFNTNAQKKSKIFIATHYWEFSSICIVWETTTTLRQSVYMQFNGQANKDSFKGASINNYQNYRCPFRVYLFVSQKNPS